MRVIDKSTKKDNHASERRASEVDVIVRKAEKDGRITISLSREAFKKIGKPSCVKIGLDEEEGERIYILADAEGDKAHSFSIEHCYNRYRIGTSRVPELKNLAGNHPLKYSEEEGHWFFDAESWSGKTRKEENLKSESNRKVDPRKWIIPVRFFDYDTFIEVEKRAAILGLRPWELLAKLFMDYLKEVSE